MCYLVRSQTNSTSDDTGERVFLSVREQQSHALFHQGRQAETEHDEEAADLTGKRCGLAVPEQEQVDQTCSNRSNQDQPAEITKQICSDKA